MDKRIIVLIFAFVVVANLLGFRTSYMRMRDAQRVLDLGAFQSGLARYYTDFGMYPLSDSQGQMIACNDGLNTGYLKDKNGQFVFKGKATKPVLQGMRSCIPGKDPLGNAVEPSAPSYISVIPKDPRSEHEVSYIYSSDGVSYKLYVKMELGCRTEYDRKITGQVVMCGKTKCNCLRSRDSL